MTNFEKWKDEILKITKCGNGFGLHNGKVRDCYDMHCSNCDFEGYCNRDRFNWLYSEYKEPAPKLTKRERAFCEAFAFPRQERIRRTVCGNLTLDAHDDGYHLDNTWFKFIKAGNPAWTVEDLLKLEVED